MPNMVTHTKLQTMKPKTFVIGDIHGAYIPLLQCLERCCFRKEIDTLITLGDICDGWPYVYECVEELLKIKNRIDIVGNHDEWFKAWLESGNHPDYWSQGGLATAQSYLRNAGKDSRDYYEEYIRILGGDVKLIYHVPINIEDIPSTHQQFFRGQNLYYKDDENRLFVHAGIIKDLTLKENQENDPTKFYWDRKLWLKAMNVHNGDKMKFKEPLTEIFIGHTATINWTTKEIITPDGIIIPSGIPITEPMHADIIHNLDTGAGFAGKLTIMDIETHEYWQSDRVSDIYKDHHGRK